MNRKITLLTPLVFVLASAGMVWGTGGGTVNYTGATNSNYTTDTNWSGGTVPDDDYTYIRNGGTVALNTTAPDIRQLWVGGADANTDSNASASSTLRMLGGGALTLTENNLTVGNVYGGTVLQSGGSLQCAALTMGGTAGAQAYYALSDGSLLADFAYANSSISGGSTTMTFGNNGGTAKFVQSGGYLRLVASNNINIGSGVGSVGEFTMTNGSLNVLSSLSPGSGHQFNVGMAGGRGSFTLAGGSFQNDNKLQVGSGGTGTFTQQGGTVTAGANEAFTVGLTSSDANSPTAGVYNLIGGLIQVSGSRGLRIGSGENATYGRGLGTFNVSGGSLALAGSDQSLLLGYKGGDGLLDISGGTVTANTVSLAYNSTATTTLKPQGTINVRGSGIFSSISGGINIGVDGYGELNIAGGSVYSNKTITVSQKNRGVLNVTNGGTLVIDANSRLRIANGSADPNADGTVTISGSTSRIDIGANGDLEVCLKGGTGRFNLNGGSVNVASPVKWVAIGSGDGGAPAPAIGVFDMTDGYFTVSGTKQVPVFVGFRGTSAAGGSYQTEGTLRISGGTFTAPSIHLLDRCDPNFANKAYLKIGANAAVTLNGTDANSGLQIFNGGSATVEMEVVSASKNSLVNANGGTVVLGNNLATLAVNRTSTSYRPSQGNTFTLISATGGTMTGSFKSITSNIPGWLRTNIAVAINLNDPNTYRPVFSGAVSGTNYVVTFQGARAGDATGDNRVDGTDLAAVGASWLKTGGTYNWLQGDFNGDGIVDGTDLAALGAGWLWEGAWPGPAPADAPLPEPATLTLLSLGGLALIRRRKS